MRVAILDTGNPSLPAGGGQAAFLRAIVPHLSCDVAMVGEARDGQPLGRWTTVRVGDRLLPFLPVLRGPQTGRRPLIPLRMAALAGVWRWRERVEPWVDLLYAHSPELLLAFAKHPAPPPMVLHVHGNAHPLEQSRFPIARALPAQAAYARFVRPSLLRTRLLITVDEAGGALCHQLAGVDVSAKTQRVPTCFEEAVFQPPIRGGNLGRLKAESALDAPVPLTVAFAGRIEEGKGLDFLITAIAQLSRDGLDPRLEIAGDGTQRAAMGRLAQGLGVAGRVRFLGWLKGADLAAMLGRASLFVLPSANEGMSIAVLEALACGTPVVASSAGAMREMVLDGVNGFVLDDVNPQKLAAGIADAASRTYDRKIVAATVSRYRGSVVAAQVERLLETAAFAARA